MIKIKSTSNIPDTLPNAQPVAGSYIDRTPKIMRAEVIMLRISSNTVMIPILPNPWKKQMIFWDNIGTETISNKSSNIDSEARFWIGLMALIKTTPQIIVMVEAMRIIRFPIINAELLFDILVLFWAVYVVMDRGKKLPEKTRKMVK